MANFRDAFFFILRLYEAFFHVIVYQISGRATLNYCRARYRYFVVLANIFIPVRTVQQYHWNINCWTENEVLAWKNSYASSCTAVAVAAAIFAGIGVTSLQLPYINNTMWATRALLTSSMALGIFSVITATLLQRTVYKLGNHVSIRLWLSRGKTRSALDYPAPYCDLPLESSAAVLILMEAPSILLNLAAIVYLIGFLLYYRYGWNDPDDSIKDPLKHNKNIFFSLVAVIVVVMYYLLILWVRQAGDARRRSKDYGLDEQEHEGETNPELLHLEEWLEALSTLPRRGQKGIIEPRYDTVHAVRRNLEEEWNQTLSSKLGNEGVSVHSVSSGSGNERAPNPSRRLHRTTSDDSIRPIV